VVCYEARHFTCYKLCSLSLVHGTVRLVSVMKVELFAYMLNNVIFRYTYCAVLHHISCSAVPLQPKCYEHGCMSMHKEGNVQFFRFSLNPVWYIACNMITIKFDVI
jgi:hypothetical protein